MGESCSGADHTVIGSALVRNWKVEGERGIYCYEKIPPKTLGTLPSMICICSMFLFFFKFIYIVLNIFKVN